MTIFCVKKLQHVVKVAKIAKIFPQFKFSGYTVLYMCIHKLFVHVYVLDIT